MNATNSAVQRVVRAICDPGQNPRWHYDVMERHRKEWPILWEALDQLVAEATR